MYRFEVEIKKREIIKAINVLTAHKLFNGICIEDTRLGVKCRFNNPLVYMELYDNGIQCRINPLKNECIRIERSDYKIFTFKTTPSDRPCG